MFAYIWPLALVVLSNTIYQVCAKSVPGNVSPFASLTVTYLVGAVASAIIHFIFNPGVNIFREIANTNWSTYLLGLVFINIK